MNPLALGFLTTAGSLLAYEVFQHKKSSNAPPPPPGTALDPGMDTVTANVVRKALESETDPHVLDHLASLLLSAGYGKSASAVADRSGKVKAAVKSGASAAGAGKTATAGMWTNVADLLGVSTAPISDRELQRELNTLGYGPLVVDGIIGPKTLAALHAFQTAQGITPSDHANVETVSSLKYALENFAIPASPYGTSYEF